MTAACGTTSQEQTFNICNRHKTAAFVQICKEGSEAKTDTIAPGNTATYTARVFDQYSQEMSGQMVTWSVTDSTGAAASKVTVTDGVVTVALDAEAGTYTVTASVSDTVKATVTVTVLASAPEHTHEWETV